MAADTKNAIATYTETIGIYDKKNAPMPEIKLEKVNALKAP